MYLNLSPSGWDSQAKINILLENSTTLKSNADYAEVISKPNIRKPTQRGDLETVMAAEDQEFLSKLQLQLNKTSSSSIKPDDSSQTNQHRPSDQPLKAPHKSPQQQLKGANPNQPDSTNLKNFFQNLLNKSAPSPALTVPSPIQTNQAGSIKESDIKQEANNESNA